MLVTLVPSQQCPDLSNVFGAPLRRERGKAFILSATAARVACLAFYSGQGPRPVLTSCWKEALSSCLDPSQNCGSVIWIPLLKEPLSAALSLSTAYGSNHSSLLYYLVLYFLHFWTFPRASLHFLHQYPQQTYTQLLTLHFPRNGRSAGEPPLEKKAQRGFCLKRCGPEKRSPCSQVPETPVRMSLLHYRKENLIPMDQIKMSRKKQNKTKKPQICQVVH